VLSICWNCFPLIEMTIDWFPNWNCCQSKRPQSKTAPVQNGPTFVQNGPNSLLKRPHNKQEGPKALGRSPEKKVKGHSGAIYRGPLMLSTKYWYRTSRWCYVYIKYESAGPWSFIQEDFWKLHFENLIFDPVTYSCNQSKPFKQFW